MAHNYEEQRTRTISSNRAIDNLVRRSIDDFLQLRAIISSDSETEGWRLFDDTQLAEIDGLRLEQLRVCASSKTSAVAICGENSSGKTAFIHLLLGIEKILPSGDGPVTGRITKLTYAPGEHACIRVYKNIRNRTLDEPEVSLSPFFAGGKPDWPGMLQALSKHVTRPKGMDEKSEDFNRWARCLLEIHFPSPTLARGINVYDTPGLLIGDAPVFTEILHDLVELIHPTILFMYSNPTTDDATHACFVAMKAALHNIDHDSFFFVNSKADVDTMPKCKRSMTIEQFTAVLAEERARRYEFLLSAPFLSNVTLEGLPPTIDQCKCFDLCSARSQSIKPFGPMMNEKTIQNIIRFVLNSDLTMATRASRLILPMIDFFLELSIVNNTRTSKESSDSETSAISWADMLFEKSRSYLDRFVTKVFPEIFQRIDDEKGSIMEHWSSNNAFTRATKRQVGTALFLRVIRPAVCQTVNSCMSNLLDNLRSNPDLNQDMISNKILVEALGMQDLMAFTTSLLDDHHMNKRIDTSILYMVNTISTAMMACATTFENELWKDALSVLVTDDLSVDEGTSEYLLQQKMTVPRWISKIQKKLAVQQPKLRATVKLSGWRQETILKSIIQGHYKKIASYKITRQKTFEHLQQYSGRFCQIECELIAARDMAKFVGQTPVVHQHEVQLTRFSVFTADWGDEKNLTVKKLTQPISGQPDAVYYEAHYHDRVARLQHPHLVNLRYLYLHSLDDQTSELWMIFPPIFSTVEQYLGENRSTISLEQLLNWMMNITNALIALHNKDLFHRNVILRNILLTKDSTALLADWGDGMNGYDMSKRHSPGGATDGVNDDVKGFAGVGKFLRHKVISSERNTSVLLAFDDLMTSCAQANYTRPVTAESIQQKLAALLMPS